MAQTKVTTEPQDWDKRYTPGGSPGGDGHALAATIAGIKAVTLDPDNDDAFNFLGKKPEPLTDADALSIRDALRPHLRSVFGDRLWDWDRLEVYAVRANKQAADAACERFLTTFGDRPYLSVHTDPTMHDRRRYVVVMAPAREVSR